MGKFKEGPPEVAPHVVVEQLAEIAYSHGYRIHFGLALGYWRNGQEYIINMPAPEVIESSSFG